MEVPTARPEQEEPRPRSWFRYAGRVGVILGVVCAGVILAALAYGVVLLVFEPEGVARATAFKCFTRAERAYFRQLRRIADDRREHLDTVQESMKTLRDDRQLAQDPEWRQELYARMARFTTRSREMAQINGPPSTRAIQQNLSSMSESATSFAKKYLHGVRAGDTGSIAEARLALRGAQLRMLRTQELGRELCD